jgi:hypothetical protein
MAGRMERRAEQLQVVEGETWRLKKRCDRGRLINLRFWGSGIPASVIDPYSARRASRAVSADWWKVEKVRGVSEVSIGIESLERFEISIEDTK